MKYLMTILCLVVSVFFFFLANVLSTFFPPFILMVYLYKFGICSFTGFNPSLGQLFMGGLSWGDARAMFQASWHFHTTWCFLELLCFSAANGDGCGVPCLCLPIPPLLNLFWKPFLVFRGLGFCWLLVLMKTHPHFCFFVLLIACGQFQEKKRKEKYWLSCPFVKWTGYIRTWDAPHSSAEYMCSAMKSYRVKKR